MTTTTAAPVPSRKKNGQVKSAPLPQFALPQAGDLPFRFIGYDNDRYYLQHLERGQTISYRAKEISENILIDLADADTWAHYFPAKGGRFDKQALLSWFFKQGRAAGLFNPENIRGRGAWIDDGRVIVHHGDRLTVDGDELPFERIAELKTQYIYQRRPALSTICDKALTIKEGRELVETCSMFRWEQAISGKLLCGWLFLAPVCGALKWRPHIWLTGGAGSGKTTVLDRFSHHLMPMECVIPANGGSSESGIRQALGSEARPATFDEFEADSKESRQKQEEILILARQASSDTAARTYRGTTSGTAQTFSLRTMIMFSSIGVGLVQQQDIERVEVLRLRNANDNANDTPWEEIKTRLMAISEDKTLGSRVMTRAVRMIPVINQTIDLFTHYAALELNSQRNGDQIGALLAGAWCLQNDKAPTREDVLNVLASIDWTDHKQSHVDESDEIVDVLLALAVNAGGGSRISLGRLILQSAGIEAMDGAPVAHDYNLRTVNELLALHGVKVDLKANQLRLHPKNMELLKLLADTKYATGFRERLKRVKGATTNSGKPFRIGSVPSNGILLDLDMILQKMRDE
ncbi:hypothetical protein ID007_004301 [Salmonella enterica]|nr:hypothetical protein [Salmonella enterica]